MKGKTTSRVKDARYEALRREGVGMAKAARIADTPPDQMQAGGRRR